MTHAPTGAPERRVVSREEAGRAASQPSEELVAILDEPVEAPAQEPPANDSVTAADGTPVIYWTTVVKNEPAASPTPAPVSDVPPAQPVAAPVASAQVVADAPGTIILDGDVSEWARGQVAVSTPHYAYVRFKFADGPVTLQAAPHTTSIMLDADSNASTGRAVTLGQETIGVDVETQFSPRNPDGRMGRGVAITAYSETGSPTRVSTHDWDFSCTPTFAATGAGQWYEARLSRSPRGPAPLTAKGLLSSGPARGVVATLDAGGKPDAWSPVFTVENAAAAPSATADLAVPVKARGAVRVVSYNVLRSSPNSKPQVFQRILGALKPDIVLVQEWEAASESELTDWFNSMLPVGNGGTWHTVAIADKVQNGGGVAVISRYPLRAMSQGRPAVAAGGTNAGKPIRAALALADSPHGPIALASVHLKSGGSSGSVEDMRRGEEAAELNRLFRAHAPQGAWRVIGGDMNLVGSYGPLETLAGGLDTDSSALIAAPARTLGDATYVTWSEAGNAFAPGRLDWILFSDASARAVQTFVLDTSRLSAGTLAREGLTAGDCAEATDHMPVVVDLAP